MMKTLSQVFCLSVAGWWSALTATRFAFAAHKTAHWGQCAPASDQCFRLGLVFASFLGLFLSPLIAQTVAAPAPEISLSLRGVGDAIVEQGEPLRIAVRVRASRGAKEAIKLAPPVGTWADAIRVEIAPASGGAATALAEAVGKPDAPQATLDKTHVAGGLWRFSTATMQGLTPGNYVVRARLTIAGASGWTGEVVSAPTRLQVVTASTAADRATQRTVNRAHDALLSGRMEEAASILDAVLTNSPDEVRLLTTRAIVAERAGNVFAAILCAQRAERARPLTSKGLPPVELQELQARLQLALPEAMKRSDKPAEWTWPPASVMKVPDLMTPVGSKSAPPRVVPSAPNTVPAPLPASPSAASVIDQPPPSLAGAAGPVKPREMPAGLPSTGVIVPSTELADAKIIGESAGQWAASAVAGSQYGKTQYSATQAAGAPNISVAGNSPDAWCPAGKNAGTDWLEVSFAKPVYATEVRIRQNDAPGAISRIEAIEPDGATHVWWEGVDPYKAPAVREIAWFAVRVPKPAYLVAKVKITLNLSAVPGWKQIDAVQLVGAP